MKGAICVTGPEATGKSTLSQSLADEWGVPWVREYAREFLDSLGRPYRREGLDAILDGQMRLEDEARTRADGGPVVCDTGPEVLWVWSKWKYDRVSPALETAVRQRHYTFTLLLDTDLPWTPDPLRENPDPGERNLLLALYRSLLERIDRPHTLVSGNGEARLQAAKRALAQESDEW